MKSGTVLENGFIVIATTNITVLAERNGLYGVFKREDTGINIEPLTITNSKNEILDNFISLSLNKIH
ncbi:hypothetical protein [Vallitalea guaymasensis]|uniref:hypothetical protein n=1 Tax=Vallitalea guaymasensis TaxID=1185412 RepID=UPI000DE4FBCB|nr:hypothetical protein [Vallitalea guaymasensis]